MRERVSKRETHTVQGSIHHKKRQKPNDSLFILPTKIKSTVCEILKDLV